MRYIVQQIGLYDRSHSFRFALTPTYRRIAVTHTQVDIKTELFAGYCESSASIRRDSPTANDSVTVFLECFGKVEF